MKEFNINFHSNGEIIINGIQGVEGTECLQLTQPYTNNFGIISERHMIDNFTKTQQDITTHEKRD